MLAARKKRYRVFDMDDPEKDVLLIKQLTALKGIRKKRLNRHEVEYKKKLKELELSRQVLDAHDVELSYAKQALIDGKEFLQNKHLNTLTTMSGLRQWSDKEDALKKNIALVARVRDEKLEIVEACEKMVVEAKKNYQKTLLGIEKIDVFLEEVKTIS